MRFLLLIGLLASAAAIAQTPPRTTIAASADFAEQASLPVVRPGFGRLLHLASDGGLYFIDDAGTATNLLTGGASGAAILAALLTVDGAASTLDADLLDGVSGDGYCLTDGTRVFTGGISFEGATADAFETAFAITDPTADNTITFKDGSGTVAFTSDITNMSAADILAALITVDGAASGVDADTLDGVSSAGFLATAGGTMTGGVIFSGVTDDLSSTDGEELTIDGGGTSGSAGGLTLNARNDIITLDGPGGGGGTIVLNAGSTAKLLGTALGGVGATANRATSAIAVTAYDNSTTALFNVYGGGAIGVPSQQAITISTGDDTTSPTSSQVELSCTTAPCTWKPGETSVVDGWQIEACNVDAADNIDVASAAGTVVVKGSPRTMTPGECASCVYSGAIWGCQ